MDTRRIKYGIVFCWFASIIMIGCDDDNPTAENPADMPYSVEVDTTNFISQNFTGNRFFPIRLGTTMVYEGENEDGIPVRVEEEYTTETKVIMGVTCVVVNVREYEDNELIEDTFDWYAQDLEGNVWYFGEASQEIENGEVVSTAGSWESGVEGALPGIIMLNSPQIGLWYRQEFFKGEAEDVAQVLSMSASVTVPYGNFENCLQTAEWNILEPGVVEHKFYAPDVGLVRVEAVKGESGFEDLTEILE